jgi:hypothetical protein
MRLHGREAEQQVIDDLLASARSGRSGAMVVRGVRVQLLLSDGVRPDVMDGAAVR